MLRRTTTLTVLTVALLFGLTAISLAQAAELKVTLILPDGSTSPFMVNEIYHEFSSGGAVMNVGGGRQKVPLQQIDRLDLDAGAGSSGGTVTLRDGRRFPLYFRGGGSDALVLAGMNEFGSETTVEFLPARPERQDFVGFIVDNGAAPSPQVNLAAAGLLVTLVLPDGSTSPFAITRVNNPLDIDFHRPQERARGGLYVNVGGGRQWVALESEQLARVDLVGIGTDALTWQVTLKDGRQFESTDTSAHAWVMGINQFGIVDQLGVSHEFVDFVGVILGATLATGDATRPAAADASYGGQPTSVQLPDLVRLRNGDILSGSVRTEDFTIQASYATLTFTKDQLRSITIEDAAGRTDQALLTVGDRVSGVLQNTTIEMTLTSGATITLEKGNIASITFARQE